jgi:hypothetical protein
MRRLVLLGMLAPVLGVALLSGCVVYDVPATHPAPYPPPAPPSPPPPSVETRFFYDALDPDGDWLYLQPYGWVWAPNAVDPFWRPYTVGQWVWTDWGWTWVSTERWGWATYHYGRWVRADLHGWVWIPGDVWGPGWVAWRRGPGVVGWAPLPPGVSFNTNAGLDWGGVNADVAIHFDSWCFVDDVRFVDPDPYRYAYPVGRNATAIRVTKDCTKIQVADRRIINAGLDRGDIERAIHHPVPIKRVVDQPHAELRPAEINRDEVRVYRPEVHTGSSEAAPRHGIKPAESKAPETPWKNDEAVHKWDRGWSHDWNQLQKVQKRDDTTTAKAVPLSHTPATPPSPQPAPPAPPASTPAEINAQHREENFQAAENAYRELVVEQERAKRRAVHANAPAKPPGKPEDKKEDKGKAKPKDQGKGE